MGSPSGEEQRPTRIAPSRWLSPLAFRDMWDPCSSSQVRPGYVESFNSKLRDELLDGETFYTLREAQILVADWRRLYNALRPHSSLGQRPPAPETIVWQGVQLACVAPPTPTTEPTMALT